MNHHRSPTHSYPQAIPPLSIHATLALRHPSTNNPTLLSPLRSIANTPLADYDVPDDFQSNAWLNPRPPLTGLGITYLRDAALDLYDQSFDFQDSPLRMQVDCEGPFSHPAGSRVTDILRGDLSAPSPSHQSLGSKENQREPQFIPNLDPSFCGEHHDAVELGLGTDNDLSASDTIGLIPDVNMYDKLRQRDLPRTGVNPLDTVCSTSLYLSGICNGRPAALLTPKDHDMDNTFSWTDPRPEKSPSPRVIQDIMSILAQPASDFAFLPWPCVNSPTASSRPAPRSPPTSLELARAPDTLPRPLPVPCNSENPNATHPSPVLNAHLGIELDELICRAERFRTKYPERDIDRAWLSHFAGKLSDRGELLADFRCYVIGCDQRNKRRDHILVHIGAHIGQRPFACSLCPLRFLRKNECKRHEASHSGFRPYSCDICGQSFVRQDLVKRHVKRTHGLKDENQPVVTRPRKKARMV